MDNKLDKLTDSKEIPFKIDAHQFFTKVAFNFLRNCSKL